MQLTSILQYAIGLSLFACLLCASFAVFHYVDGRRHVRNRALAYNPAIGVGYSQDPRKKELQTAALDDLEKTSELLFTIENNVGKEKNQRVTEARRDMVQAGFFHHDAPTIYFAIRVVLAIGGGVSMLFGAGHWELENPITIYLYSLIAACFMYLLPVVYISLRKSKLKEQCNRGVPDFFDMLVVSATAGVPPRAAIERISRDLAVSYPYLGANLFLTYLQLRAGLPLPEAIDGLGKRIDLQEFKSFGMLLAQTEELGTKMSDALRVFSAEMRARRMLAAEEKANALPVKLVIPLAIFVFPIVLLVIFLPIVIRASGTIG